MTKSKAEQPSPRLRLRVTAAAESMVRSGHPWLFAESVRKQNRPGALGELAVLYDRHDRFLAAGLYDPTSPICVRILHAGKPQTIDRSWWKTRLNRALLRRQEVADEKTTGYRCLNGEADGFPGLVLDRYEETFVLKLYTAAWLPRMEESLNLLGEGLEPKRIVLRLSRNIQDLARKQFNKTDGEILHGPALEGPVVFLETGLRFEADVLRGQKTGFFLDQRENRRRVETLAAGRSMLNAFSFTGGFSLYAARGGARSVTNLDVSKHALAGARRNFALNQSHAAIAACRHQVVQADAFDWLSQNAKPKFELVVLDPPSLAKRESERSGAIAAYRRLGALGINMLSKDGILLACSCSAHVTAAEFFDAVREAAARSGRKFQELQTAAHAPDHPANFKEAEYLKAIYLSVE